MRHHSTAASAITAHTGSSAPLHSSILSRERERVQARSFHVACNVPSSAVPFWPDCRAAASGCVALALSSARSPPRDLNTPRTPVAHRSCKVSGRDRSGLAPETARDRRRHRLHAARHVQPWCHPFRQEGGDPTRPSRHRRRWGPKVHYRCSAACGTVHLRLRAR